MESMNSIEKFLIENAIQFKNDGATPLDPEEFKKDLTGKYKQLNKEKGNR